LRRKAVENIDHTRTKVKSPQTRWCYGKTPLQTFVDSVPLAREKLLGLASAAAPAVAEGLGS